MDVYWKAAESLSLWPEEHPCWSCRMMGNSDIIKKVQSFIQCQLNQLQCLQTYEIGQRNPGTIFIYWSCVALPGKTCTNHHWYLFKVDQSSSCITTLTAATTQVLTMLFVTHGIPEPLISDNWKTFTSHGLCQFVERNEIRLHISSPYHPATNGLVERAINVIKKWLKRSAKGDVELRLARFSFYYKNTSHSTTSLSPAKL